MNVLNFFAGYWWLIFVFAWPIMGVFNSFMHYRHRSDMLKMMKSYADQGKEPPSGLLDAMKTDNVRGYDGDYYGGRRYRRRGCGWSGAITFTALAAGFGYAGYYGHMGGESGSVFTALAIAFGIAAFFMLIRAVILTLTRRKMDPRDYDDRMM